MVALAGYYFLYFLSTDSAACFLGEANGHFQCVYGGLLCSRRLEVPNICGRNMIGFYDPEKILTEVRLKIYLWHITGI